MSKIYTYEDMEKLSQKIKKIKKKKYLEEIRDIIIDNNPKLNITENSYGIYLCFNELSNNTFVKLDKFVKKCIELEEITKTNSEYNFINSIQSDKEDKETNSNFFDSNSRLKFSNKEKNLIKKRLYDNALKINSEINEFEKNYLNCSSSDTINSKSLSENNLNDNDNNQLDENKKQTSKIFLKKNNKKS